MPTDITLAIRTAVMSQPGIRLSNLITTLHRDKADHIYQRLLAHHLYVDLKVYRLTDYDHVQVFLDSKHAPSCAALQPTASSLPRPSILQLTVGSPIILDGNSWTIFNPGVTEILLLSEVVNDIQHGSGPLLIPMANPGKQGSNDRQRRSIHCDQLESSFFSFNHGITCALVSANCREKEKHIIFCLASASVDSLCIP